MGALAFIGLIVSAATALLAAMAAVIKFIGYVDKLKTGKAVKGLA